MKRASRNWESIGSVQTIRLSAANLLPGRQDGHNPLLIVASRQQRPQVPRTLRRAEMPQRLRLDLPDALPREVELLADLVERVLALAALPSRASMASTASRAPKFAMDRMGHSWRR